MLEEILASGLEQLNIPFDGVQLKQFRLYYSILSERSRQMNLTAITGEDETALLHFLDCAAVLTRYPFSGKTVLDLGSGAGFPGLVLKLLCPNLSLTLIDSTKKRVDFQEEVCAALTLSDIRCLHLRAEEAPTEMREAFDIVISRAVARCNILAELSMPFVVRGGVFIAMKGSAAEEERAEAEQAIRLLGGTAPELIRYSVPGLDAERNLILSRKQNPTPSKYPRRFAQIKKQPL